MEQAYVQSIYLTMHVRLFRHCYTIVLVTGNIRLVYLRILYSIGQVHIHMNLIRPVYK